MDQVKSEKRNLQEFINDGYYYNIPRYQRLYVWGDEQIKTLFEDVHAACTSGKSMYFLGAVITVKSQYHDNCFDLVDGQQRFTTLWLIANELQGDLSAFTKIGEELRLKFAIRKEVYAYFDRLKKNRQEQGLDEVGNELYKVSKALKAIRSLISEKLRSEEDKQAFIQYLLTQLYIIVTEVPKDTNLNKLFETLNNRGIQLSQHEILKNKLLSKISNKQARIRFGKLWNACSNMGEYVERNINIEVGVNLAKHKKKHDLFLYPKDVFDELIKQGRHDSQAFQLTKILGSKEDKATEEKSISKYYASNTNDDEFESIRSILTFPQLLLHTLRIYQFRNELPDIRRINEKELLSIFEEVLISKSNFEENISKDFVETLWEVRQAFDKYVIKWVKEDDSKTDETHVIKHLEIQNQKKGGWTYYFRRIKKEEYNGLALLQSMLYHSQENITQYWLTPYLLEVLEYPPIEEAYQFLKQLDNVLLTSDTNEEVLSERTWACMAEFPTSSYSLKIFDTNKKLGTGFPHYWFYKLEFVLWHERFILNKAEEWKDYKLNSRNSVEHIGPQNPKDDRDKVCIEQLDDFGNLVLVTRSINSEYGYLSFKEKKAKFENKKEKGGFDSLKSDLIYSNNNWSDEKAANHRNDMIQLLMSYLQKTRIDD
ncbi:DUF262 domain-containing protein [Roseivirga echinicomitans]|uniref:DUF262 domain-containing protein n=1 Tax=Roseivirga echinicomitans TaxID=296218 RepID=A0A150X2M8_9BACT|nr:DUF262 domain-containing protein [Roseivirga echinicomitans]KYG72963.1 hypothetical protein AWN68_09700 [Roseivirga echinicomitans]